MALPTLASIVSIEQYICNDIVAFSEIHEEGAVAASVGSECRKRIDEVLEDVVAPPLDLNSQSQSLPLSDSEHNVSLSKASPQEEQSSPDTTISSSMFANKKDSQASVTSSSTDHDTQSDMIKEGDHDVVCIGPPDGATVEPPPNPIHHLTKKRSLWNVIRGGAQATTMLPSLPSAFESAANKGIQHAETEAGKDAEERKEPAAPAAPEVVKRRSFVPFTTLNVAWPNGSRRHTVNVSVVSDDMRTDPISALGRERSLDGSIHVPFSTSEAQLAEDAVRFADARHLIKTEQDVDVIRDLADRLEQGWKEKVSNGKLVSHRRGHDHWLMSISHSKRSLQRYGSS
jgi:hypothetical protein